MNIALIIAGGRGMRMGREIPKQFLTVDDKPVIAYTLEAFEKHPDIDVIAVVCVEGENIIIDLLLLGGEFLHLKSPFLQIQTDV